MSDAYTAIGEALFDLVDELDIADTFIEEIEPEDAVWKASFNRPPKSDELYYPAFAVMPWRDLQTTEDTETDTDTVVYMVRMYVAYHDADAAEAQLRAIAEIVRTALRNERLSDNPLSGECYDLSFTGAWGGDPEQGERFYQIEVSCRVTSQYEAP